MASGAVGTRRAGEGLPVGIDDNFRIGSDSKSFTSLLAGQFVEAGKLRWNSTLAEVFPELKGRMNEDYAYMSDQAADHANAKAVLHTLKSKEMPPGGPFWSQDELDLFTKWMSDGYQR